MSLSLEIDSYYYTPEFVFWFTLITFASPEAHTNKEVWGYQKRDKENQNHRHQKHCRSNRRPKICEETKHNMLLSAYGSESDCQVLYIQWYKM
uniref:Uncharacterized protein n=1 Tax=Arion vulgaris TaxID=1028688 RepID=A0A0B7B9Q6_9EUPU